MGFLCLLNLDKTSPALLDLDEVENGFVSLVEEKVEDAHVGQKTMLVLVDLIVAAGNEVGIGNGMLGTYGLTIVVDAFQLIAPQVMVGE